MKKIEEDFLNDNVTKTDSSFSDIKNDLIIDNSVLKNKKPMKLIIKIFLFVFVFISLIGFVAIGVEAIEYKEAIDFFEDNQLSSYSLTRKQIKLVYKDIITNSFEYSITGEVINHSLTVKIPGYKISSIDPKFQDTEYMWEYWNRLINGIEFKGSGFKLINKEEHWENDEKIPFENKLIKYVDSEVKWEIDLSEYEISYFRIYGDIVFAYPLNAHTNEYLKTYNPNYQENSERITNSLLFIDSKTGEIIKIIEYNNANEFGIAIEENKNVIKNDDGTFTLVSVCSTSDPDTIDKSYLVFMKFDINANVISTHKEEINYPVNRIIKLNDGYLVLSGGKLVQIDDNGKKIKDISIENDKYLFRIHDLIEYNGKIYISTRYVDKEKNKYTDYWGNINYNETIYFNNYCMDNNVQLNQNLTDLFRSEYHAALLVFENIEMKPQLFYTINGAIGWGLSLSEENELVWEVDNISRVKYDGLGSAYSYGGFTEIYEYVFNENVKLINIIDTGEEKIFRR